jgi:hypothetical protein
MNRRRFVWMLGQIGLAAVAACSGSTFVPRRDGGDYDFSIPGGPYDFSIPGGPYDFSIPGGPYDFSIPGGPYDLGPYGLYDGFYYAGGARGWPASSALARLDAHARRALAAFERLTDRARRG